jgi:hypothetical protein
MWQQLTEKLIMW